MTEENALVLIKPVDIPALFTTDGAIDKILAEIEKKATGFAADVDTAKGRKEIASMAHKVARSKTLLDGEGKKLVADMKAKTKLIDVERKKVRDFCDDLKNRVRQPLDEWQAAEDERIAGHKAAIELLANLNSPLDAYGDSLSAEDLREKIRLLENTEIGEDWEEFQDEGLREKEASLKGLRAHLERQEKYEAEQAELERLRKAEAERQAKEEAERKERERKEYEERIRKEAEEKAKREAEQRERELKEAAARAEREKIEAEARAKAEKEAAVKAAEEKARREAEEKEQKRLEAERKAKEAAERKTANKRHRAKIRSDAIAALVTITDDAEKVFEAIENNQVPNITVNY